MHRNTHVNIRHVQTWIPHTHGPKHTEPHMLPHTASPPPMAPYTLPPSLPHSLKRRELVKDARRQDTHPVAAKFKGPGHETRRQSALTHSTSTCPLCPSACTCMCPMPTRHAYSRLQRATLSRSAYARTMHACAQASLVKNTTHEWDTST